MRSRRKENGSYQCTSCGSRYVHIADCRAGRVAGIVTVRRRRECEECGHRETTHEFSAGTMSALAAFMRLLETYADGDGADAERGAPSGGGGRGAAVAVPVDETSPKRDAPGRSRQARDGGPDAEAADRRAQ